MPPVGVQHVGAGVLDEVLAADAEHRTHLQRERPRIPPDYPIPGIAWPSQHVEPRLHVVPARCLAIRPLEHAVLAERRTRGSRVGRAARLRRWVDRALHRLYPAIGGGLP